MVDRSDGAAEIAVSIKCSKCGQDGESVWERWQGGAVMIALSKGFYERVSKKSRPLRIELVCDRCGAIQPSPRPPVQPLRAADTPMDDHEARSQPGADGTGTRI